MVGWDHMAARWFGNAEDADGMMASMVASRASVVASMASMASLVESRKWLKRRAAEPKRDDERVNGLAHSGELTL